MSEPRRFDLRGIAPQPWKNGAGLTREIAFGGARAADFDWRLSVAEVVRDAPFSAFPGIDRCITLLRGAGMHLRAVDGSVDHALTTPLVPFRFAGDIALEAALVDGACSDFNLMTRRGRWHGDVEIASGPIEIASVDVTLLLACIDEWQVGDHTLSPGQGLLWRAPPAEAIDVRPRNAGAALLVARLCHDRGP